MGPSSEKTAEHCAEIQSDLSVMPVSVGAWEHSRKTIPRWNGQRGLAGAAAEGKQLQLATSAIACHMRFAPPDPGNGSNDCPLFCKPQNPGLSAPGMSRTSFGGQQATIK